MDERPISGALDPSHHELIATALVTVLDEVALFVDDAPLLSKVIYISAREGCARGILDERRRGGEDCESSKRRRVSRRALARSDPQKEDTLSPKPQPRVVLRPLALAPLDRPAESRTESSQLRFIQGWWRVIGGPDSHALSMTGRPDWFACPGQPIFIFSATSYVLRG